MNLNSTVLNNFIKRTLTGLIFVGILISAILYSPYTFAILFSLITALTLWEFYGLLKHYQDAALERVANTAGGVYLFLSCFLNASGMVGGIIFLPYLLFIMYTLIRELYAKAPNPINNWAFTFFAQIYCAGSFSLMNYLAFQSNEVASMLNYAPWLILSVFIFVWLNDTGAFLVGSLIGKHKLFERISPKKSWEGFWGGFVIVLAGSQAIAFIEPLISHIHWFVMSAVVVLFATWGDLTESLLKRTLGVKDSGNILPGHGGMLDRFDSVLMALPAAYIYIELFIRN